MMLAPILAAFTLALVPQEASVSHQASGTFNVSITPVAPADGAAA